MFNCLIFSIDRPSQADLLLRSIRDNFKEIDKLTVLYKYTTKEFMIGYDIIKHKDYGIAITWVHESNFKSNTKDIINGFNKRYSVCFVDDEVILRSPDIEKIDKTMLHDVAGFSLRLGENFPYAWNAQQKNTMPKFTKIFDIITWNWHGLTGDYGYMYCINSIIRDTEFFKEMINSINFTYPNNLEMAITKYNMNNRPVACAFSKSISINIANNLAQKVFKSRTGEEDKYSLENLNKKFLDGYIIDVSNLYGHEFEYPTCPVSYKFKKDKF